jgi:alkylation response protein AidB-like acyl-CoA dehydrogenase
VTSSFGQSGDEFVRVAVQAFRAGDGSTALDTLGWWPLLSELGDDDHRVAAFALFRAQGRELASSNALGGLMAQPYLDVVGGESGSIVATIFRESARHGSITLAVGDPAGARLLVDRPGRGVSILDPGDLEFSPVDIPGRLVLHEVGVDPSRWRTAIGEADAAGARARSVFLGRVAMAFEMLGAAETALAVAVEHARTREQFGRPIGTFQAVRHLLALATTDCTAVESVAALAVKLDSGAPAGYGAITKALAGRNGRRACERALQVLGAIGFTAEHSHHHFHSRVLALDSLLGTSAELSRELGSRLREGRSDPRIPATLLLG